jgi:hypothetical protein
MGPTQNTNKITQWFLDLCKKNYDWVVRSIFLLVLKLQDIDTKLARLLKHGILHATSNFVFWGFNGMGPYEAFSICKSLKFKD